MYVIEGDTSGAKGMADELLRLAALVKPYDGLGPHLRPIPTGPNGRGSPQKSTPQTPRLDFCGCPGRSARWDGVRGVRAGFPFWGFPNTPLSQRHGRPTRSPHIDTGHMCHRQLLGFIYVAMLDQGFSKGPLPSFASLYLFIRRLSVAWLALLS